jgi:hypothetical protein
MLASKCYKNSMARGRFLQLRGRDMFIIFRVISVMRLSSVIHINGIYQLARGWIFHRRRFVWCGFEFVPILMALKQGRCMMIMEEGGKDGKVLIFNLIQEGNVNNTWVMHGQLVNDNQALICRYVALEEM